MEETIIKHSKLKMVGCIVISFLFIWLGFTMMKEKPGVFVYLISIIAIVFALLCGIIVFLMLIFQKPAATLSEKGLTTPFHVLKSRTVAWNEIVEMKIIGKKETKQVMIRVRDTHFEDLGRPFTNRSIVSMTPIGTKYTCEEILELLEKYHQYYTQSN